MNTPERLDKYPAQRQPTAREKLARGSIRLLVGKVKEKDQYNLTNTPGAVIITPTHRTNADMHATLAYASKHKDVLVTGQSTLDSMRDPISYASRAVLGERFSPVSTRWVNRFGYKKATDFDPKDSDGPVAGLNEGLSPLIASHNPTVNNRETKPGYLAALTALRTGATIVPVGVNYENMRIQALPRNAEIVYGEPYTLEPYDDIEFLLTPRDQIKTPEDRQRFLGALAVLKQAGKEVFERTTSLLK